MNFLTLTETVTTEIAKVPVLEFVQANGLVALAIVASLICGIVALMKKKRRY